MSGIIIYNPETMTYTLSNGTDKITLPNWARRVIRDEFEHETRPLSNKIEILSDALALARDENAKLREEFRKMDEWHSKELSAAMAENAKLREWCGELLHMAESNDPDFLHWPKIHDELRKLGVKIVKL